MSEYDDDERLSEITDPVAREQIRRIAERTAARNRDAVRQRLRDLRRSWFAGAAFGVVATHCVYVAAYAALRFLGVI